MDKILVELYIPVINRSYDVYLPLASKMHEVEGLLSSAIREISEGYFVASLDTVLCDRDTGTVLDINKSALELGLRNGSKLMLI